MAVRLNLSVMPSCSRLVSLRNVHQVAVRMNGKRMVVDLLAPRLSPRDQTSNSAKVTAEAKALPIRWARVARVRSDMRRFSAPDVRYLDGRDLVRADLGTGGLSTQTANRHGR